VSTEIEHVLVARGVRKTFEPDTAPVRALRGADLVVRRGELVALMGPSGSGKSTLLNVVAGLERADDGEVVVAGHDVTAMGEDALARMRRRHIGIVFQFFNLIDGMSALENVALAALAAGSSRRQAMQRAGDLLDLLGLLEKSAAAPATLAGGQRQRLAIARAIIHQPDILVFDDSFSALDLTTDARLRQALWRELPGVTKIVVAQRVSTITDADRIVVLEDGQMVGVGTHEELLKTSETYREIVESQLGVEV
jgi:putative ABC transport system ATP-binding protein